MFTPGFSQAFWIGWESSTKGTFWHPLTYLCAALLGSVAIELIDRRVYANELAAIEART